MQLRSGTIHRIVMEPGVEYPDTLVFHQHLLKDVCTISQLGFQKTCNIFRNAQDWGSGSGHRDQRCLGCGRPDDRPAKRHRADDQRVAVVRQSLAGAVFVVVASLIVRVAIQGRIVLHQIDHRCRSTYRSSLPSQNPNSGIRPLPKTRGFRCAPQRAGPNRPCLCVWLSPFLDPCGPHTLAPETCFLTKFILICILSALWSSRHCQTDRRKLIRG